MDEPFSTKREALVGSLRRPRLLPEKVGSGYDRRTGLLAPSQAFQRFHLRALAHRLWASKGHSSLAE